MENIVHARIDYRLIHGQVITRWLKVCEANTIIIIDDKLSKDDFLGSVYTMAAPSGIKVKIVSVQDALSEYKKGTFYGKKVLLLFKSVNTAHETVTKGLKLKFIQVGGLENKAGRKLVHNQITLDLDEYEKLKELEDTNMKIYFQTVPAEDCSTLQDVRKKL